MWKYIKGATSQETWLNHSGQEIVFWGRSNVGKSSLINALANIKIAKTSQNPGRTKIINYFESDLRKIIVDLPGYGYAKLSKKEQDKIGKMIDIYFNNSSIDKHVILLIDAKVGFMALDWEMINYINQTNNKLTIVATKVDKASQAQIYKLKSEFMSKFIDGDIFLVSSSKNKGILELKEYLAI